MGSMAKKLDKFRDENAPPARRIKSLQSFVDHATESEMKKLFSENSSIVYSLVLSSFELWCQQASAMAAKGKSAKGKASLQDLFAILVYLRKIFQLEPELVQTRWQSRSISSLLEALLCQENKHAIRLYGWDLLLQYLADMGEALDENRDKKFCTFFRSVLDFEPFVSGYAQSRDILLKNPAISGPKPVSPASPIPTPLQQQKETGELLARLLEFMSEEGYDKFPFWYRLFKANILTSLYPRVCKEVELLDESDPTGFTAYCPRDIQKIIVEKCIVWIRDNTHGEESHFNVLFENTGSIKLLLEIFRQTMELPLQYMDTTDSVIDVYAMWVRGQKRPALITESVSQYMQEFIRHMSLRFNQVGDRQPTPDMLQKQVTLCKKILGIFVEMSVHVADLDEDTWVLLLKTITDIAHSLFFEITPSSPQGVLSAQLATPVLEVLFTVLVRSRTTDMEIWDMISDKMVTWCQWKETIEQWKRILVQLSCMYCVSIYETTEAIKFFDVSDPQREAVMTLGSGGSANADAEGENVRKKKKADFASFMSVFELDNLRKWEYQLGTILLDGLPINENIQWDQDMLEFLWQRVYRVLRNPVRIPDPANNALALRTLELVCDVFLRFDTAANRRIESRLVPHNIVLFAPWLFDACSLSSEEYADSVVTAYGTMCRLFVRRMDEPDEELEDYYLSHLYGYLHEGLTGENKEVLCAIIEHSSTMFAYCFKGVNILIPDYLRAVRRMMNITFQPAPPEHVRIAAISLLTSLICFPNHYAEVQLPDLKYTVQAGMMENGMDGDGIGDGEDGGQGGPGARKTLPFVELKNSIASLLFAIIKDEYFTTTKCMCLWGLCVLIMEELHHTPKEVVVVKCVKMIQSHCMNSDTQVARTAVDVFVTLAQVFDLLEQVDPTIVTMIIEGLCGDIIEMIQSMKQMQQQQQASGGDSRVGDSAAGDSSSGGGPGGAAAGGGNRKSPRDSADIVVCMFQCLTEWIMCNPVELLADPSLCLKVFEALEFGLFGESDDGVRTAITFAPPASSGSAVSEPLKKGKSDGKSIAGGLSNLLAHDPSSIVTAEAAEIMIAQLLNVVNNFPSPLGASRMASILNEYDDHAVIDYAEDGAKPEDTLIVAQNLRYFVFNRRSVMSFVEIPRNDGKEGKMCRIIVRDMTGKYCIDAAMQHDDTEGQNFPSIEKREEVMNEIEAVELPEEKKPKSTPVEAKNAEGSNIAEAGEEQQQGEDLNAPIIPPCPDQTDIPVRNEDPQFALLEPNMVHEQTPVGTNSAGFEEKGDVLDVLINLVDTSYGEMEPSPCDPSIHTVVPAIPSSLNEELAQVTDLFNFQHTTEEEYLRGVERDLESVVPIERSISENPFDQCRVFLSQFGLTLGDRDAFLPLENSSKVQRSIKAVDGTPGRELLKVGVIYVGAGQDDQRAILKNKDSDTTPQYSEFVHSLGWTVDLGNHSGFMGGLDKNLTNGATSSYWSNVNYEMMFHVATMMPTSLTDAQQIMKKRHIGNDIVHIVWSAHYRDYRPTTISSQFNDAHLVIYPLSNGLYRIQVYYKKKISLFGPLTDGMIVSKELLAPLVRQTAINANRAVRYGTAGYKRPYPTRRDLLNELVGRYSVNTSFDNYMFNLFVPLDVAGKEAGAPASPVS